MVFLFRACVIPVLVDIYLSKLDQAVMVASTGPPVRKMLMYMENFRVIYGTHSKTEVPLRIEEIFEGIADRGIRFPQEAATGGSIRFLELTLSFFDAHLGWAHSPRSTKSLLPFMLAAPRL